MELIHRIVDTTNNTITERPLNEQELKQYEKDRTKSEAFFTEEAKKTIIRNSALAKLIDLGLTEEEIAAL